MTKNFILTFVFILTFFNLSMSKAFAIATCDCGPAPKCEVLGLCWCGCPFAAATGSASRMAGPSNPNVSETERTIRSKCSVLPTPGKLSNSEMQSFLNSLKGVKKPISCANPRSIQIHE